MNALKPLGTSPVEIAIFCAAMITIASNILEKLKTWEVPIIVITCPIWFTANPPKLTISYYRVAYLYMALYGITMMISLASYVLPDWTLMRTTVIWLLLINGVIVLAWPFNLALVKADPPVKPMQIPV